MKSPMVRKHDPDRSLSRNLAPLCRGGSPFAVSETSHARLLQCITAAAGGGSSFDVRSGFWSRHWPLQQGELALTYLVRQPPQINIQVSLAQSAFPKDDHPPAGFEQRCDRFPVAPLVFGKLSLPELDIAGRRGGILAPFVSMPVTTVNEYHRAMSREDQIRRTGQRPVMQAVTKSVAMKEAPDHHFRPSVFSANARHHSRSDFRSHDVCHAPHYFSRRAESTTKPWGLA